MAQTPLPSAAPAVEKAPSPPEKTALQQRSAATPPALLHYDDHVMQTTLAKLLAESKIKISITGTGKMIQYIAELKIENLTGQSFDCKVPPMILESSSGKNQDYVCPHEMRSHMGPHATVTGSVDGICINRSKPPVGKGVTDDLVINLGDPTVPQNPNAHISVKQARDLLDWMDKRRAAANADSRKRSAEADYKKAVKLFPLTPAGRSLFWADSKRHGEVEDSIREKEINHSADEIIREAKDELVCCNSGSFTMADLL